MLFSRLKPIKYLNPQRELFLFCFILLNQKTKISSPMMSQPFSEKYRPSNLSEMIGNVEVISALQKITHLKTLPNMLFFGPPGTGKTTAIRAIAKQLYKTHYRSNVLELNASDERGIDTVRETIKSFANTSSFNNQTKLVILDEADSMSRDAQNAMRRVMEDFSRNARFCFLANYSSKIINAIQSRCTKFRFSPVILNIKEKTIEICDKEGIAYDEDGLDAIEETCDGDVRKMVNDIEGIKNCFGRLSKKNVYMLNGMAEKSVYLDFYNNLPNRSFDQILVMCRKLKETYSIDCDGLINNLVDIIVKSKSHHKMKLLKLLSDIQYRLAQGCSEEVQLNAVIGLLLEYQ